MSAFLDEWGLAHFWNRIKSYVDDKVGSGSDISGGGVSTDSIYSTEETVIGTWIDGKPLYRKVFDTSVNITFTSGRSQSTAHIADLTDIDTVVSISGNNEGFGMTQGTMFNNILCIYNVYATSSEIAVQVNAISNFTKTHTFSIPYIIILEYTKTTD